MGLLMWQPIFLNTKEVHELSMNCCVLLYYQYSHHDQQVAKHRHDDYEGQRNGEQDVLQ